MDSGDFGDFFGFGDRPERRHPATVGGRVALVCLARLAAMMLAAAGFVGAWWIEDAQRAAGFWVAGVIGVAGWLLLSIARRFDLL